MTAMMNPTATDLLPQVAYPPLVRAAYPLSKAQTHLLVTHWQQSGYPNKTVNTVDEDARPTRRPLYWLR